MATTDKLPAYRVGEALEEDIDELDYASTAWGVYDRKELLALTTSLEQAIAIKWALNDRELARKAINDRAAEIHARAKTHEEIWPKYDLSRAWIYCCCGAGLLSTPGIKDATEADLATLIGGAVTRHLLRAAPGQKHGLEIHLEGVQERHKQWSTC